MGRPRVLVADSSLGLCQSLCQILEPSLQVCYTTSGAAALELADSFQPDVLVIDPLLPELDGLSVLKALAATELRPAVLVLLQFSSPFVEQMLRELDVELVIMKPCNLQAVAQRVQDLLLYPKASTAPLPKVSHLLMALNISPRSRGFVFFQHAVEIMRFHPSISITKELYPTVAEHCGVSPGSVELSLRRAIHAAWKKTPNQAWIQCFGLHRDGNIPKPSNSTFIATVVEYSRPDDE